MTQKAKGPDAGNVRANREITLAGERDSRENPANWDRKQAAATPIERQILQATGVQS